MRFVKQEIKEFFFVNPSARLRVRELERAINAPLPSVIRYTKELTQEEFLTNITIGKTVFFTANKAHKTFKQQKTLFNLEQLHKSKIIEHIKKELSNPTIILFGSYSRGEDVEESDIDLFIQTSTKKALALDTFEQRLRRNIHLLREESLKELPKELKNNIVNGITLNGSLVVFS